eukprot:6388678-Lingulodinium_polyedra.AAC.1
MVINRLHKFFHLGCGAACQPQPLEYHCLRSWHVLMTSSQSRHRIRATCCCVDASGPGCCPGATPCCTAPTP